jgi:NADH-quinone oxidoreductase subunit E
MPYSEQTRKRLEAEAAEIMGRYPRARSALLPLLYLVQAEEGYLTRDGITFCAQQLGITETEVTGVATFYTMYSREDGGDYHVGVCTNTLCAIMGGDQIYDDLVRHVGAAADSPLEGLRGGEGDGDDHHGPVKSGNISIERVECNAACDYAPVMMVNWEFFDNMTPDSARKLVDDLRAGKPVAPSRGPGRLCTWREASRVLAGFGDGLEGEGPSAGEPSLVGLKIAKERGWKAPEEGQS